MHVIGQRRNSITGFQRALLYGLHGVVPTQPERGKRLVQIDSCRF